MPQKPFREKDPTPPPPPVPGSDKSEFEDSVNQGLADLVKRLGQLKDFSDKAKPEKDEGADKYAKDFGDIQKGSKDQKEEHKHEKSEKERKDIAKESDTGVL